MKYRDQPREYTMSDTWTLIANPTAGGGHGRRIAERATLALQDAGQAIELRYTRKQGHATELARGAVADGVPRLVVCGGDGIDEGACDCDGNVGRLTDLGSLRAIFRQTGK